MNPIERAAAMADDLPDYEESEDENAPAPETEPKLSKYEDRADLRDPIDEDRFRKIDKEHRYAAVPFWVEPPPSSKWVDTATCSCSADRNCDDLAICES
jgi:hypothetical protein